VVGTGGSGFCAEAAPSGVIGFFMAVAPPNASVHTIALASITLKLIVNPATTLVRLPSRDAL